jgi:hypothetical protein
MVLRYWQLRQWLTGICKMQSANNTTSPETATLAHAVGLVASMISLNDGMSDYIEGILEQGKWWTM